MLTRPDPTRQNPTKSWPGPTRPDPARPGPRVHPTRGQLCSNLSLFLTPLYFKPLLCFQLFSLAPLYFKPLSISNPSVCSTESTIVPARFSSYNTVYRAILYIRSVLDRWPVKLYTSHINRLVSLSLKRTSQNRIEAVSCHVNNFTSIASRSSTVMRFQGNAEEEIKVYDIQIGCRENTLPMVVWKYKPINQTTRCKIYNVNWSAEWN